MFNKGSYIKKNGIRRKVLEEMGEIRFLSWHDNSEDNWEDSYALACTIQEIERDGWVEEAAPWEPKTGDKYWLVESDGAIDYMAWEHDLSDKTHFSFGNCFQTKEQAEAARDRIKEMLCHK